MPDIVNVILLGVIEGITEFLPISSTGHLSDAGCVAQLQRPEITNPRCAGGEAGQNKAAPAETVESSCQLPTMVQYQARRNEHDDSAEALAVAINKTVKGEASAEEVRG